MGSLLRRVAFGFSLAVVLALAAGWLAASALRDATVANDAVAASAGFLGSLDALLLTIIDAETSERGFAITGDRAFLMPYERARARFDVELARLRTAPEAAAHVAALDAIEAAFRRWEIEQAGLVISAREGSPPAVTTAAARAVGGWMAVLAEHGTLSRDPDGLRDPQAWAVRVATLEETVAGALASPMSPTARRAWSDIAIAIRGYRDAFAPSGRPDRDAFADAARLAPYDALSSRLERVWAVATAADDRVARLLVAGSGPELVPQIRSSVDSIRAAERERVTVRAAVARQAQDRAGRVAWFAPLGAVLVALVTVVAFVADLGRHVGRLGEATQALADGAEVGPIGERGPLELRRFTNAFDRMTEQVRTRDREAGLLAELAGMTQAARSLDESLPLVAHYLPRLVPGSSGALWITRSGGDLERAAGWGAAGAYHEHPRSDGCWALRRGRPYVATGPAGVRCPHDAEEAGSTLCLPLMSRDEALGVLSVHHPDRIDQNGGVARVVRAAAEQLALALANLRLREALQEQTIRDPLTGLFNRRFLEHGLALEVERASRSGAPVSLVMVDVDHFKRINDTYGHDAGDAVLEAVAHELSTRVRPGDIACRFGGEEFALVLPGADATTVALRAEQLRTAIAALSIDHGARTIPRITASFGVVTEVGAGIRAERLVKRADEALYAAKRAGRDRVLVAPADAA